MSSLNSIYLKNFNKVIITQELGTNLSKTKLATLLKNISKFGYTLSSEVIEQLNTSNYEKVYKEVTSILSKLLGANKNWTPMYPNFPQQVMEATDAELYLNAIFHYLGDFLGLRILPDYITEKRSINRSVSNLKVIDLGSSNDLLKSLTITYNSPNPYSPQEKEDFITLVTSYPHFITDLIPKEFGNKENMCFVASVLLNNKEIGENQVKRFVKNVTDVLRLATALSDGDISLAKNSKFKNFSRPQRKFLLACLEQCPNKEEDLLRHKNKWIKLMEKLHIGDYINSFTTSYKAVNTLRNKPQYIQTFNSSVELFLKNKDIEMVTKLLMKRPSDFARRLNHLLSISDTDNCYYIINSFDQIASQIPQKLLLELLTYFNNRNNLNDIRVFFPKGMTSKAQCIKDERSYIDNDCLLQLTKVITNAIVSNLKSLDSLGNVFIDEQFKNINLPWATRSASNSLNPLSRGSKIDLDPSKDTIRMFIWWKDKDKDRVDVDLSSMIYNEKWINNINISFRNLRNKDINAYHSGDITSAPNGACEFLDININDVLKSGNRYIAMSVNSYTEHTFNNIPEASAGWMLRSNPNSGEIFDPKSIQQKFDITMNSTIAIPMVVDCLERKIIWMDMAVTNKQRSYNTIEANLDNTSLLLKAFTQLKKPTMFDLLSLHANTRGKIVTSKNKANTIFDISQGNSPNSFNISL